MLHKNGTPIDPEVLLGEEICTKLKNIYFKDTPFAQCVMKISLKFTELKQKAQKFFVGVNEVEMLQQLRAFTEEDIKEMMDDAIMESAF